MKSSIKSIAIAVAAVALTAATACQRAENTNISVNVPPSNTAVATSAQPSPVTTPASSGEPAAAGSPSAAYKAAYAARKNKDVEGLKKLLSKDILEFFTEIGKAEKKTLDQMIKELCEEPQASTDDTRNEKIDGDRATIEYLDDDGEWRTMDFVKENGAWKLTVPKADGPPPSSKDDKNDKDDKKSGKNDSK